MARYRIALALAASVSVQQVNGKFGIMTPTGSHSVSDEEGSLWSAIQSTTPSVRWTKERIGKLSHTDRLTTILRYHHFLHTGWLEKVFLLDDKVLAIRSVHSPFFKPQTSASSELLVLSRFTVMRREKGALVLENPLGHCIMRLVGTLAMELVPNWTLGQYGGLPDWAMRLTEFVAESGLMTSKSDVDLLEEKGEACAKWEFHDVLFHARSRWGRNTGHVGKKAYGGAGAPSVRPPVSGDIVSLSRPHDRPEESPSFWQILESRRSVRTNADNPLTRETVSTFLYYSARIIRPDDSTPAGSHRPYASAGGLNELEIYLTVFDCVDLDVGLYRYAPQSHQMERLPVADSQLGILWSGEGQRPPVYIVIAARFQRVFDRYSGLAYSLILKNVGCLLQTMYLVATALGRGPCASGAGNTEHFARVSGLDYYSEGSVGEFCLR